MVCVCGWTSDLMMMGRLLRLHSVEEIRTFFCGTVYVNAAPDQLVADVPMVLLGRQVQSVKAILMGGMGWYGPERERLVGMVIRIGRHSVQVGEIRSENIGNKKTKYTSTTIASVAGWCKK